MKYFISVENTSYFYWQLELLIESFLIHNLQDDLIICFAENDSPKVGGYSKNIVKYGKKIMHENVGKQKDCLVANRLFSLRNMVKSGVLEYPFAIIHADMIMKKPLDKYNKSENIVMNNYAVTKNYETTAYIEQTGLKQQLLDRNIEQDYIENFPFSMPIIFNENKYKEFSDNFFDKLLLNLEDIIKYKSSNKFPVEKTCWIYTLLEASGFYTASGAFLTCELLHNEDLDVPFIHYKNGIPPIFSKNFFKFEQAHRYQTGPYECLLENNITPNTEYLNHVIKSYMRKN